MRKLLLTLCLWSTVSVGNEFPMVIDPVINATPPDSKVTAGYFTLINENNTEIVITKAYSPTIAKVEIHRSFVKDDVAKMERQDSVILAPGATIEFEHGGYHLMLMELTEPLTAGQTVDIILSTSVGDMLIEMPVEKMGMSMGSEQDSHTAKPTDSGKATESEAKMEENHQMNTEGEAQVSSK